MAGRRDVDPSDISFSLPWPPSANTYYRAFRGIKISAKGREYREIVLSCFQENTDIRHFGLSRLAMHITTFAPTIREYDLDNRLKPLIDAIEHTKMVFDDDTQIDDLHIVRGDIVGGNEACVDIIIRAIPRAWEDVRS